MKQTASFGLILGLALAASLATADEKKANVLIQGARAKETVQGDLKGAIALYQNAVKEAGGNRTLAVRALIHIAECYQKLGDTESRKIYEQVVREYADQKEAVMLARTRMGALQSAAPAHATARQIWTEQVTTYGSISQDGRYLTFTAWKESSGELMIRDLVANTNRRLTYLKTLANDQAGAAIVSPNSRQVAFTWYGVKDTSLQIAPLTADISTKPTILLSGSRVVPFAWTPDGQNVLAALARADGTQLALVSVSKGTVRPLKALEWRWPNRVSLSPDGRYVAYDVPAGDRGSARAIFVLSADGSRETVAVQTTSDNHSPLWSPDGSQITFISNRTRNNSLWTIRIEEGKPKGTPELVKSDIGQFTPLGITRSGALYYVAGGTSANLYVAEVDQDVKLLKDPVLATDRFLNSSSNASWSPDGGSLAYFSPALAVRSLQTGEDRGVQSALSLRPLPPQWSPDGQSLLVATRSAEAPGFYRVDVATGKSELLHGAKAFGLHDFSRDGKLLFYVETDGKEQILRRFDFATGVETNLKTLSSDNYFTSLAASPDGKQVAYIALKDETRSGSLEVVSSEGGPSRQVFTAPWIGGSPRSGIAWTPDQKYLLFVRGLNPTESDSPGHYLWKVLSSGGIAESTGIVVKGGPAYVGLSFPRVHPDGRHIIYTATQPSAEVWALENFLPKAAK